MKQLIILFACLISNHIAFSQEEFSEAKEGYAFEITHDCKCTGIKSQGRTGTCWSFSTQSFFESELIRKGEDPFDLSEMFVVRNIYLQKAQKYLRYHGKTNFSEGSLGHDPVNVLEQAGAMTEAAYDGKIDDEKPHDHTMMFQALKTYLDGIIKDGNIPADWKEEFNAIMDTHIGKVPESFEHKGKTYTAKSFAKEVMELNADDYVSLTSFSHHPFYSQFVLEVPDNFSDESFYNVPIEELLAIAIHALKKGYSIEWDGDVSEKGFSARQGVAVVPDMDLENMSQEKVNELFRMPHPQKEITQKMRQIGFDNYTLTDDHLMHITGLAKDRNGEEYFLIKNSWGEMGKHEGFLYASKAYFKMNTISILIHKDAIPIVLKDKLKL